MKHKNSQLLYAYWNSVRAGRIAPKRFDIEPGRLGTVLPDTFVLERNAEGALIYRLAGTRLCEGYGLDLRGRDFLEGLSDADRAKLKAPLDCVMTRGAVCVHTLDIDTVSGSRGVVEVLLLPLTINRDTIERFLGSIVWLTEPVRANDPPLGVKRLKTCQLVWPNGPSHEAAAPGVAESVGPRHLDPARQTPFMPHIRNARIVRQDRRQFRVYDGGLAKPPHDKH